MNLINTLILRIPHADGIFSRTNTARYRFHTVSLILLTTSGRLIGESKTNSIALKTDLLVSNGFQIHLYETLSAAAY